MDYEEIKEKHPKAWELFAKSILQDYQDDDFLMVCGLIEPNNGLYSFFDNHGLYVTITPTCYGSFSWEASIYRCVDLEFMECLEGAYNGNRFTTRTEAEAAAFNQAFELLETKLSE